jgi:hypothetical protein
MSAHTSTRGAATPKASQLAYLRDLALQTGTTFSPPRTRRQASCEIDRLKKLKASRGTHVETPRDMDPAEQPYATEQKSGEVLGYGSNARRRDPLPPSLAPTPRRTEGEPFELGCYETKAREKRGLYGIRIDGRPRIIDAAAEGRGRTYTVEEDLHEKGGYGEVKAIVADYIAQAQRLGGIPMARHEST